MPQVDIKYSSDLQPDNQKLFEAIQTLINEMDSSAGVCKSRAYPTDHYYHTHFYMRVALLRKPHRDSGFMKLCLTRIESIVKPTLPSGCYCSVELVFTSDYYITTQVEP